MDAEEWRSKAGPWARATMPDAQELDVVLTQWTRTPDGRWWAECEAILPARYEHADGRTRLTGAPTPISVPADDITPIPGEDYSTVPTDGAIAGRQWVVEKLREYTEDAPAARLHRRDCWQARESHQRITTEDAVDRLARQAIAVCDICRPDRALRRLCRATLFLAPAASPVGGGRFTPRCCRRPRVPLVSSIRFTAWAARLLGAPPRRPGGAAACHAASASPPRWASAHTVSSRPYSARSAGHNGRPHRCRMNSRIASFAASTARAASRGGGVSGMRTRLRPGSDNQPCPADLETNDPSPGSV